jgi:hypothetical protein
MGGENSGRWPKGSRPISKCVKEMSHTLDSAECVRSGVIRAGFRSEHWLEDAVIGRHTDLLSGQIVVLCQDTAVLHAQVGVRHRLPLGLATLTFHHRGFGPISQQIVLMAGLTGLTHVVFWGWSCPLCAAYSRKLYLPLTCQRFACRKCLGLRYVSQQRLDALSRREGDDRDREARLAGLPTARMMRALMRAGRCVYRDEIPPWATEPDVSGMVKKGPAA